MTSGLKLHKLICLLTLAVVALIRVNGEYVYRIEHLDVLLDHFSFTDNRTFSLRYLINDSYWAPKNGPIFFYTGNEGDINTFAQNTGFLWESAPKFGALILFAEHRYYGESLPFGNKSFDGPEYFGYLTSEQALADFVDVIYHIKYKRNRDSKNYRRNPVIAFGGSYGGMLAAWMRMKYPAVIEGALAASAPIWQFTGMIPCNSYNQVVTSAFNSSSTHCTDNIRKSWDVLSSTASTKSGQKWLNENWKLCKPVKSDHDILDLKNWISNVYSDMAMINYPYSTSFLMPVPANPVSEMCKYLTGLNLEEKNLLMAVFNAVTVYFNYTGDAKCLDWSGDPSSGLGEAGWNVQSCNEMVMPICGNGVTDMFWSYEWNFQEYSDNCYKQFRIRPIEFMAEKMYGGKDIRTASNIIFSNGLLDPWISGGVTHQITPKITIIILQKSAHHLDLRASNNNDPDSVTAARKLYLNIFEKWIKKFSRRLSKYESLITFV